MKRIYLSELEKFAEWFMQLFFDPSYFFQFETISVSAAETKTVNSANVYLQLKQRNLNVMKLVNADRLCIIVQKVKKRLSSIANHPNKWLLALWKHFAEMPVSEKSTLSMFQSALSSVILRV